VVLIDVMIGELVIMVPLVLLGRCGDWAIVLFIIFVLFFDGFRFRIGRFC
jgi:hypothetical protein